MFLAEPCSFVEIRIYSAILFTVEMTVRRAHLVMYYFIHSRQASGIMAISSDIFLKIHTLIRFAYRGIKLFLRPR